FSKKKILNPECQTEKKMISTSGAVVITAVLIINILSIRFYLKGEEIIGLLLKALGDSISLIYICIPVILPLI
ncbi:MAG: hypothetical protein J6A75_05445, partial [Lachnospiraceae bacterium]|nr:hypothetical protein [Lachnospiraceae bacterium]